MTNGHAKNQSGLRIFVLDTIMSEFTFLPQAPSQDAAVEQSTGLFDSSSDMFRTAIASLLALLGLSVLIGIAYHYFIFVPRGNKGKKKSFV